MNGKEVILSRMYRMVSDLQAMIGIVKTTKVGKPRADKKYSSNAEKCKAYRQRKKDNSTTLNNSVDTVKECHSSNNT